MRLANRRLEEALREFIDEILDEGRAATREKAQERIRAKLPTPQKRLEDTTTAKELRRKGKGSVQHLGEAKNAEQLIDEEQEDELACDKERDARELALDDRGEGKHGRKD